MATSERAGESTLVTEAAIESDLADRPVRRIEKVYGVVEPRGCDPVSRRASGLPLKQRSQAGRTEADGRGNVAGDDGFVQVPADPCHRTVEAGVAGRRRRGWSIQSVDQQHGPMAVKGLRQRRAREPLHGEGQMMAHGVIDAYGRLPQCAFEQAAIAETGYVDHDKAVGAAGREPVFLARRDDDTRGHIHPTGSAPGMHFQRARQRQHQLVKVVPVAPVLTSVMAKTDRGGGISGCRVHDVYYAGWRRRRQSIDPLPPGGAARDSTDWNSLNRQSPQFGKSKAVDSPGAQTTRG